MRRTLLAALTHDAPSLRLRLAVAYFRVTGLLALVAGVSLATFGTIASSSAGRPWVGAIAATVSVVAGVGALWTANLLRDRRRKGAVVAVTTLLAPVVQAYAIGAPTGGSALALVGALVVASVWNELE